MIQFVSVFLIVFLLGMLAWPSVEPRLNSYLRRRRRRTQRRGYYQD